MVIMFIIIFRIIIIYIGIRIIILNNNNIIIYNIKSRRKVNNEIRIEGGGAGCFFRIGMSSNVGEIRVYGGGNDRGRDDRGR